MNQDLAKKLFEEGGVLIFLGVPVGTEFGIDFKSWNTDERFRGIKMIPPGIHYIFYSATSSTGDISPRSGFFHNFQRGEIVLRKWDMDKEDMSDKLGTDEEISNFRHNLKAMDNFLGPYPYDIYEKWINLIENVTGNLVSQLIPHSGIVRSALELEGCSDADRPRVDKNGISTSNFKKKKRMRLSSSSAEDAEDQLLPIMKAKSGTALRSTEFPEKHYPEGSTPSDITQHSLDSSYVLENMISKYKEPSDIIGELQFSFICFLVGHSLEAFEQWKRLINLFCSCEVAITKYRRLYDLLLNTLKLQVTEIPEEFLADIVSNNNFFYMKVRDLFRNIQSSNVDGNLKSKMNRFKEYLTETYNWNFEHLEWEEDEDAPVVVDINEYSHQLEEDITENQSPN
ncbi:hypothetical protein HHI36_016692 [Cryptolaemus montrouzieri]|uniref:Protein AAR2 homolog n=1 Tax=Cryptolaemus montrouzieri TaxID=559131 RepID=A0ABD2NKX4_9CUCU